VFGTVPAIKAARKHPIQALKSLWFSNPWLC
jgi:ABC-type antimicrobial peptide transport system permease subunit